MELAVFKRSNAKKSETNQIRIRGDIPGVIYAPGQSTETILVKGSEVETVLRHVKEGHLSTEIFTLTFEDGKKVKAVIKEMQYHVTTYKVIHMDFLLLQDKVPIEVYIPIECLGFADSSGVKLGGTFRQVIRRIKVKCLPKDLPKQFQLDVSSLGMMESKRLSDLVIPKNVMPLALMNEVVAVVGKR